MPLIFKLVGSNKHIISQFEGLITLTQIKTEFKKIGISDEDITKIKFITERSVITEEDKTFMINKETEQIMFIFTDMSIRPMMQQLFEQYGIMEQPENHMSNKIDPSISMPLTEHAVSEVAPEIPQMTESIITESNKNAMKILADKDLMTLFDIYLRRPEVFSTFGKYIQHGTIVQNSTSEKTTSDLTPEELEHYKSQAVQITLPVSDEIKLSTLIRFKGHIILSLNYILSNGLCQQASLP